MKEADLAEVLLEPCISEKSTRVAENQRQFVFRVARRARKAEIKRAVEVLFEVEVSGVQVCNVKGKSKRFRAFRGGRPDWKKAYVTLKPGFDLDFLTMT